ncbi:tetratricopeptide repeat protein [Nisaea denitrificans]|uniref:tetratricopeptide repeat protein n=1 Tax=Nisaea denitrificans TaxID=390877 RepID=UPI00040BAA8B|nr:tetratricopeptide repeat protein [Nisaea denitrificans]
MRRLILAALFAIFLSSPVSADQTDTRLDPLFAELKAAASITDALYVERQIWAIWSQHGSDAEIDLRFQRGILLMNAGRLEEAARIFSTIVEIDPEFSEAWNKRATLLYLMGDVVGSVRDIERTLALEPRHFGALSGLGLIYEQIESADGAIRAFTAALEINPHMPWIVERLEALEKLREGEPL